jgi:hypothetical protein
VFHQLFVMLFVITPLDHLWMYHIYTPCTDLSAMMANCGGDRDSTKQVPYARRVRDSYYHTDELEHKEYEFDF